MFGYLNTKVNYDILSYLPKDSESMKAQDILNDDFNLSSVDMLVVNNMKDKDVLKLKKRSKGSKESTKLFGEMMLLTSRCQKKRFLKI